MRTYGRVTNAQTGQLTWVEVDTDANGQNDEVYLTTLCQVLLLNLNESPFYATYGIPQVPSVQQQVWPDYYVALTQQNFAPFFASLTIERDPTQKLTPTYTVTVVTNQGAVLTAQVAT